MTEDVCIIPHFYSNFSCDIRILNMETQSQDFRLTWVNYSQKLTESFHKFLTSEILCNVTLWVHNGTSSSNDGIGGGPTGSNSIKVCNSNCLFSILILITGNWRNKNMLYVSYLILGTSSHPFSLFTMVWGSSLAKSTSPSCYNTQRCSISGSQKYY